MFYIVLILTRMCMFPFQILLDVLVVTQTNKTVVMTATAGLMAGTQIFREEDSDKLYPNGLLTMIGKTSRVVGSLCGSRRPKVVL